MQIHKVRPLHSRRPRKRVGRGRGSGLGAYSGRGLKGQKSRAGGGVRPGFEGGQTPQLKGLPKLRGFKNRFRIEYQVVNLERLSSLPAGITEVTPALLAKSRLVRNATKPIKLLGQGDLDRPLRIQSIKLSKAARSKVEAAGGQVEEG